MDFSWGYRREEGRLLERLDHFDWVVGRGGESGLVPRTTLSDHALVILTLNVVNHSLAPHSCRIPDSIYIREEVHSRIVALWDKE